MPEQDDPVSARLAPSPLDAASASGPGVSRRLVAVMALATGVAVANNYYAQPLLHTIGTDLRVGAGVAGLIVTFSQVGYAAGLVFLLPLGDLVERRRLVTVTCLATALALAGAALAPTTGALLAGVVVIGITSVVAQILVPFAASLASDTERGSVVGSVMTGLLLGVLLARTVAGYVADAAGWRAVYWLAAALMVAMAVVLKYELPRYHDRTGLTYPRLLASIVTIVSDEPVLRWRSVYGALGFGSFSVLWTSLAFLLSAAPYHFSVGTIGLFGLVGAAGAVMASAAGRFADRGRTRVLTWVTSAFLLTAYLGIWLGGRSLVALLAGIVVLDIGAQGLHITNQAEIYRLRPAARSRVNAAYMTCYFAGGAVGSALSAALYGAFGWDGVALLGTTFGAAALLVCAFQSRTTSRTFGDRRP